LPYLDGLPPATSVSVTDLIALDQGGTPNIPGTATTRKATIAQFLGGSTTPFLPIIGGTLTGPLIINSTLTVNGATALNGSLNISNAGTGNQIRLTGGVSGSVATLTTTETASGLQISGTPLVLTKTVNYSGTASLANEAFRGVWAYVGTSADVGTNNLNFYQFTDNMTNPLGTGLLTYFGVTARIDALSTGSRQAFSAGINNIATTANKVAGISPAWVGAQITGSMSHPEGGTSMFDTQGAVWGAVVSSIHSGNSTFTRGNIALELDVQIPTGSSTFRNAALQIVYASGHRVPGAWLDAAITIGSQSTSTAGMGYGLLLGNKLGPTGFDNTSTLVGSQIYNGLNVAASNYGVDFLTTTFATKFLRSQGFSVDGSGVTQIGTGLISPIAGGMSIDTVGSVGTAVAVAVGGTNWTVGDFVTYGPNNSGLARVQTLAGSAVATLAVLIQPVTNTLTPPANPVAAAAYSASPGTGLTVNVTWDSTRTELSMQPTTGGTVRVGAGMIAANGIVATALTNVGPTGAHTTVQEWLTVKNPAGVVRWIPMF
jgi:hypothetical protein